MAKPLIEVVVGDITTLQVDAIVNAADEQLRGGVGTEAAMNIAVLSMEVANPHPEGRNHVGGVGDRTISAIESPIVLRNMNKTQGNLSILLLWGN